MNMVQRAIAGAGRMLLRASGQVTANSGAGWSIVRGSNPGDFQGTGRDVRMAGWERNAVVQSCVRIHAELIASVPFEAYRLKKSGAIETLDDHPIVSELLEKPRGTMSGYRLRGLTATHYLLYGNALWRLLREGRRAGLPNGLSGIDLVHPEDLSHVWASPDGKQTLRFSIQDWIGGTHDYPVDDVVHFRDLAGGQWLFGYPRASATLLELSTDTEANQYVRQMVKNSGAPGIAVMVEGTPDATELKIAKGKFQEEFVDRGGRGGVAFMNAKDIKVIGFNLRELEFPDLRAITGERLCSVFFVDPRMVGIGSAKGAEGGLSGQQYVEARKRLIQNGSLPIMQSIESDLNLWLTPEFGQVYVRFSREALKALTMDEELLSTRTMAEMTGGAISRDEARETLGRDPKMVPTQILVGNLGRIEYPVAQQLANDRATPPDPQTALPASPDPTPALPPAKDPPATDPAASARVSFDELHVHIPRSSGVVPIRNAEGVVVEYVDRDEHANGKVE